MSANCPIVGLATIEILLEKIMNIFLSWSGDRSKTIAELLKKWLPYFVQAVKPWMSSSDIDKGTRWSADIASRLEDCSIGIICLTPENIEAPWIMFESGALSKTLDKAKVCPLLFEIEPSDLKGPLVQFQTTKLVEEDFKKLIHTINNCLEDKISEPQVDEIFYAWWPKLESDLSKLLQLKKEILPKRKDREILEEILELVRQQARKNDVLSCTIPVSKLAENLSLDSTAIIDRLRKIGINVNTQLSDVDKKDMRTLLSNNIGKVSSKNTKKNTRT